MREQTQFELHSIIKKVASPREGSRTTRRSHDHGDRMGGMSRGQFLQVGRPN